MFVVPMLSFKKAVYSIIFIISTAVFLFHAYIIIIRHLKYEILEIHKVIYNDSLPMPVVSMSFESMRNLNNSFPFAEMSYKATIDKNSVPDWAISHIHDRSQNWLIDAVMVNAVAPANYEIAKSLGEWPLRVHYATGKKESGFKIYGSLNTSNFIGNQPNREGDRIKVAILSFDSDTNDLMNTYGVPEYFELLPCDELSITISLETYKFINRSESPCRDDYPPEMKAVLKDKLKPEDLFNSILAPNLPYDPGTCESLCVIKVAIRESIIFVKFYFDFSFCSFNHLIRLNQILR